MIAQHDTAPPGGLKTPAAVGRPECLRYNLAVRRSSRVLILGIALLVLGAGNWIMGADKMHHYARRQRQALARGGPTLRHPLEGTAAILDPHPQARQLYEDATAKYEYYRVVYRGGRLLVALGLLLTGGAIARRLLVPQPPPYYRSRH